MVLTFFKPFFLILGFGFFSLWFLVLHILFSEEFSSIYPVPGIYGPPDPGRDRSEVVRDFNISVGSSPSRSEIIHFFGPGPTGFGP